MRLHGHLGDFRFFLIFIFSSGRITATSEIYRSVQLLAEIIEGTTVKGSITGLQREVIYTLNIPSVTVNRAGGVQITAVGPYFELTGWEGGELLR